MDLNAYINSAYAMADEIVKIREDSAKLISLAIGKHNSVHEKAKKADVEPKE